MSAKHVPKTVDQRRNADGFPKARELVEMKPTKELSLAERRVFNWLIENAVNDIASDKEHEIAVSKLRANHKGSERVHDSVKKLMTTLIEIPTTDDNGLPAMRYTQLLVDTLVTIDEDDPRAVLKYRFTATLRDIIKDSKKWGRLKGYVLYAFTSKYSIALYEAICVRINLKKDWEFLPLKDFRRLMDVADGSYSGYSQLKQKVIDTAVLEVNGLSNFMVEITDIREGGLQRGKLKGFEIQWRDKTDDEWNDTTTELLRPKVGRKERLSGNVEMVV